MTADRVSLNIGELGMSEPACEELSAVKASGALQTRGVVTSRGFVWRIHCGVEVTESSTKECEGRSKLQIY